MTKVIIKVIFKLTDDVTSTTLALGSVFQVAYFLSILKQLSFLGGRGEGGGVWGSFESPWVLPLFDIRSNSTLGVSVYLTWNSCGVFLKMK